MYEKFFGLNEKPFQIQADPAYLFMSKAHESAYIHLEYGILENKGFVVITGEIGSGKTTLINYLLENIDVNIQTALINNTLLKSGNLLKMLCQDFDINTGGMDETERLMAFYKFLVDQYTRRKRVILIIDEAQNLSGDALEEVRMLSNFEMDKQPLFQIILVGQPELKYKLKQKSLEQLAQRVSVHYHISGLSPEEVESYIKHRLKVAGAKNLELFTKEALKSICDYSRGIPRVINILCDSALVYGFADGLKKIDLEIVEAVVREREVGGFVDLSVQPKNEKSYPDFGVIASDSPVDHQDSSVEQKVLWLEQRLGNLEKSMTLLINERGDRDKLILELFKMLHENLESRYHLISKLASSEEIRVIVK
jgi:general secretion pathway protein A